MTKLYLVTDFEDGYSWIRDYIDEESGFLHTKITNENFDLFPVEAYLEAIDSKLETWNYGHAMGFAEEVADRMKLIGVEEKATKKMFYDWIIDKGLCIGLDR